ncbi:hypothetical protein MKW92_011255 [Papaver armeniacum]|nr:hypothetical protein MKW92_011255 [Papaver armeniacum]
MAVEDQKLFMSETVKIIDACRQLHVVLTLKSKELRSSSFSPKKFSVSKTLIPQSDLQKKLDSIERNVRFISTFAFRRDKKSGSSLRDEFPEEFIRFLLIGAVSENETAKIRSCQLISELCDKVIDCMKIRVEDKVPQVRMFAVRALARFADDAEFSSIIDAYLEALPLGQKDDVCKPPSNATSATIIDCTLDVSESVRKAAYRVLANKFPLQSLSIKLRTTILQRGLAERSSVVTKEFFKLMKDEWLVKCCNGNPIMLLEFLDVETYETVGEAVMRTLLKAGMVDLNGQTIQQILESSSKYHKVKCIQQMEAEVALYWRTLCQHLQKKTLAEGSDGATTTGSEATVYAPEESDNNGVLKKIIPLVSDYVELVRVHLAAGPKYCFTCRQLLLLGVMLDYSETTNRKVASAFVQELLHMPLEHEVDEDGEKVIIGDGINREWATAVSQLAKKLAQPCRERTADFMQWMQCLAVAGLLLENVKSLRCLQGRGIKPDEILLSLLLPGAQHVHLDVQRVSLRCLGLYGLLKRKPSSFVKQLRISLINSPSPDRIIVASQALVDLGMWHGRQVVDQVMGSDVLSQAEDNKKSISLVYLSDAYKTLTSELLDLLISVLARDVTSETYDRESFQAVLGEGIGKILILSENYPSIPALLHHELLVKLIELYFGDETKELQRFKQCLSIFFEHYPALARCISKAFIPVIRSMWPAIYGSSFVVSNLRERAKQASRFMLQKEKRTKQIAYKSVFLGAKSSFSTGGKVTIYSLRKEHCSSSKEELPTESKLIVDLMDEYDDHFDELDEGWTCTKSLWQAQASTYAITVLGILFIFIVNVTSFVRFKLLLWSNNAGKGLDFPVMQIKSLALVGLEMRFFPEIVKTIKELLKDHEEVNDSRLCAAKVVDLLMRKKLDRFSHPYYLMGGYERARSNVPPKLFLWLITKSGYFMVEDGISIGSSFSEHIVRRKFSRELSSKTAVSIGLEAILNKNVTCKYTHSLAH